MSDLSLQAHHAQNLLSEYVRNQTGVAGQIGFITWLALGQPDGWSVYYGGMWCDAEDLSEAIDDLADKE